MDRERLRYGPWYQSLAALLLLAGCSGTVVIEGGDGSDGSDGQDIPRRWHMLRGWLAGVGKSIWGRSSDDIWVVGGTHRDPIALRGDHAALSLFDTGADVDLNAVFGADDELVWIVGYGGRLLRYQRSTDSIESLTTPTEAALFDIWGAAEAPLYAVGVDTMGYTGGSVLRVDGIAVTPLMGAPADPAPWFFSVWGTSSEQFWILEDGGRLHGYSAGSWTTEQVPATYGTFDMHGTGPDDIVIVGGTAIGDNAIGQIFQRAAGGGVDVAPPFVPPLYSVFVSASGVAAAAGWEGTVLERRNGSWTVLPAPPAPAPDTFLGVWIDERGDIYVTGGDAIQMKDGVVYRYGPDR